MPAANYFKAQAKAKGLDRYRTYKPCKHGHLAERYTKSGDCVECAAKRLTTRPNRKRREPAPQKREAAERLTLQRRVAGVVAVEREPRHASASVRNRNPAREPVIHLKRATKREPRPAEMAAERTALPFRTEGMRPVADAGMPSSYFTAEQLALADLWSRRIAGDLTNQRNGLRAMYPTLEEWTAQHGESTELDCPHVSGKTLGECSVLDLALSSLATRWAVDHLESLKEPEVA